MNPCIVFGLIEWQPSSLVCHVSSVKAEFLSVGVVSGLRTEGALLQPPSHIAVPYIFYLATIWMSENGLGE